MTLDDIKKSDKEFFTATEIASVLGSTTTTLTTAIRDAPDMVSFPVIKLGTRYKIPKEGFLNWYKGKE